MRSCENGLELIGLICLLAPLPSCLYLAEYISGSEEEQLRLGSKFETS